MRRLSFDTRERKLSAVTPGKEMRAVQTRRKTLKGREEMSISKELLEILACPKCKGEIYLNSAGDGLICKSCSLVYPIKEDIPVMLIDEALPYDGKD